MSRNSQFTQKNMEHLIEAVTRALCISLEHLLMQKQGSFSGSTFRAGQAVDLRRDSAYRALGLDPNAPDGLVKMAYQWLARRLHPDHGGSAEAMSRLNQAYEQISRERGWK